MAQHGVCSEARSQLCGQAAGFHHSAALERCTAPHSLLGNCRRVIRRLLLPFLYRIGRWYSFAQLYSLASGTGFASIPFTADTLASAINHIAI